jgi:hypothetical protein
MKVFVYHLHYCGLSLYVGISNNVKKRIASHRSRRDKFCGSSEIPKDWDYEYDILDALEVPNYPRAGSLDNILSLEQKYIIQLTPLYNKTFLPGCIKD